jgi:preprotein translocase subunit SecA
VKQELGAVTDAAERKKRTAEIAAEIAAAKEIVRQAGGLFVIGTERHESRRIDNQLRGRSGRQGDPGASRFYLSLEDDLMRIFGSERMDSMLQKLGIQEGEAIIHPWINKALEKAQQKVEARNFEIRKTLLKFDDVMNDQRKVIYEQRKEIMSAEDVSETVSGMRHSVVSELVARCIPEKAYPEQWDVHALHEEALRLFGLDLPVADWAKEEGIADQEIQTRALGAVEAKMAEKAEKYGAPVMRMAEKSLLLQLLDQAWKDHLLSLDHLRQGINLRAYGQRDPLNEYKREAFRMFETMLSRLRETVTAVLCHLEIRMGAPEEAIPERAPPRMQEVHEDLAATGTNGMAPRASGGRVAQLPFSAADPATWGKVQRNAPCPCGSGKKYKHCHGSA